MSSTIFIQSAQMLVMPRLQVYTDEDEVCLFLKGVQVSDRRDGKQIIRGIHGFYSFALSQAPVMVEGSSQLWGSLQGRLGKVLMALILKGCLLAPSPPHAQGKESWNGFDASLGRDKGSVWSSLSTRALSFSSYRHSSPANSTNH